MSDGRDAGAEHGPLLSPTGNGPSIGTFDGDRVGTHRASSVRVFAPPERGRRRVLRWAARHAARTGAEVQVLVDPEEHDEARRHPSGVVELFESTARDLGARLLAPLHQPGRDSLARNLAGAAAGARLLVVPQSLPELPDVVERATEPVVAVPDRPLAPTESPVVLAYAPWTGPEVVGVAFETAARYGVDLRIVQAQPQGGDERSVRACEDTLAAWRLASPEVTVDVDVVGQDPVEALWRRAREAQLIVMGRPARGRAREIIAPSPASELLRMAVCPVLLVPPPGRPHVTWSAQPGWGAGG